MSHTINVFHSSAWGPSCFLLLHICCRMAVILAGLGFNALWPFYIFNKKDAGTGPGSSLLIYKETKSYWWMTSSLPLHSCPGIGLNPSSNGKVEVEERQGWKLSPLTSATDQPPPPTLPNLKSINGFFPSTTCWIHKKINDAHIKMQSVLNAPPRPASSTHPPPPTPSWSSALACFVFHKGNK